MSKFFEIPFSSTIPFFIATIVQKDDNNPCVPSPCGPNSQCRVIGSQGACSCLANYVGRPPNCRPECISDNECPSNRACKNERCVDPCIGVCGQNTYCSVVKHNPVCTCNSGYEGDPFSRCTIIVVTCKNFNFINKSFRIIHNFLSVVFSKLIIQIVIESHMKMDYFLMHIV